MKIFRRRRNILEGFVWPKDDRMEEETTEVEIEVLTIDMFGFIIKKKMGTNNALEAIKKYFLDHGLNPHLLVVTHDHMNLFFSLPIVGTH